jgi:4-hydroxybenzoate polyprenyltransferase
MLTVLVDLGLFTDTIPALTRKDTSLSWRSYFELLRFPAVFTAVADVMMGYLVTFGSLHPSGPFVMLAAISASLYLAGMVLNDVVDANIDAKERPERPIPSKRIDHRTALILGVSLMAIGLFAAGHLGYHGNAPRTTIVAVALAGCIVLYDARAKRTVFGPFVMGGCRALNVLLGMSLATAVNGIDPRSWATAEWMLAGGVGIYIVGVTLFARGEATNSPRRELGCGIGAILAGLALIAAAPLFGTPVAIETVSPLILSMPQWILLWTLVAAVIVRRCLLALRSPLPQTVQQAVRTCIRSIIVIDAAIVLGFCGPAWGCAVLALLLPMLVLERWASTT